MPLTAIWFSPRVWWRIPAPSARPAYREPGRGDGRDHLDDLGVDLIEVDLDRSSADPVASD